MTGDQVLENDIGDQVFENDIGDQVFENYVCLNFAFVFKVFLQWRNIFIRWSLRLDDIRQGSSWQTTRVS